MAVWTAFSLLVLLLQVWTGGGIVIQQIRLAGGNSTAGRVEIQVGGVFGTVCDDAWDNKDATVVCKQLGLTGGVALTQAAYGVGTGPIHMDDVSCAGNEDNLADCYFSPVNNCNHNEDASVECQPAGSGVTPAPFTTTTQRGVTQPNNCSTGSSSVRLLGLESTPGLGYVLVQANNGTFGFVCDDGWDVNAAKVVCSELCFTNPSVVAPSIRQDLRVSINSTVVFAMDDVSCTGRETSLRDCQHRPYFQHNCKETELAAVTCVDLDYPTPPAPSPSLQCRDGDLIAVFSKSRDELLEAKHLRLLNPNVSCGTGFSVDGTDKAVITVVIPFDDCGTLVTQNDTHINYTNSLFMESTSRVGAITRANEYVIELTCEMARNATVDGNFRPLTETVTQRTEGQFNITMTIFQDQAFSIPVTSLPLEVTLGDWVNSAVELDNIDSRLKLVVTDCLASPDPTDTTAPTLPLMVDKCVEPGANLEVVPLTQNRMGYRLQSFKFDGYSDVVMQCDAIVCLTSEVTSECDRSCNNSKPAPSGRRRRDVRSDVGGRTVYTVRSQQFSVIVVPLPSPSASTVSSRPAESTNVTQSPMTSTTTTTTTTTSPSTSSPTPTTAIQTSSKLPSTPAATTPPTTTTASSVAQTRHAGNSSDNNTSSTDSPLVITIRATMSPRVTTNPTPTTTPTPKTTPTEGTRLTSPAPASSLGSEGIQVLDNASGGLLASAGLCVSALVLVVCAISRSV